MASYSALDEGDDDQGGLSSADIAHYRDSSNPSVLGVQNQPADTTEAGAPWWDVRIWSWATRLKLVGAVLLVGALLALIAVFKDSFSSYISQFLTWVQERGVLGWFVFGAFYACATFFCFPVTVLSLAAGFIFRKLYISVPVVSLSFGLGTTLAFLVARFAFRKRLQLRFKDNVMFQALNMAISDSGWKIVLFSRLSPIMPPPINFFFGVTDVNLLTFIVMTLIGSLPLNFVWCYFGSAARSLADIFAGNVDGGITGQIVFWGGMVASVVMTVYLTWYGRVYWKRISEEHRRRTTAAAEAECLNPNDVALGVLEDSVERGFAPSPPLSGELGVIPPTPSPPPLDLTMLSASPMSAAALPAAHSPRTTATALPPPPSSPKGAPRARFFEKDN